MDRIATFLVRKRNILLIVLALLAALGLFGSRFVKKNSDMKAYLPDGSMTKEGLAIMKAEFPAQESDGTLKLMFRRVDRAKEEELSSALAALPDAGKVESARAVDPNGEECLLITVTAAGSASSEAADRVYKAALAVCDGMKYDIGGDVYYKRIPILPSYVMLLAVGIVSAVLLIMSESFLEPPLFLVGILSAIALNMGTNLIFGQISAITDAIAAVLQLALSMDYSIMLMARYRSERKATDDKIEAMRRALRGSFSSVAGSAQTTFAGLLTLVFMSFTIGRDLGFVLAKGVFFSLLTVFGMLPALIVFCDKALRRTAKKAPVLRFEKLSSFVFRARVPLTAAFAVIFLFGAFFQGGQKISFTGSELDHISEVFGRSNDFALVYDKTLEAEIAPYLDRISADKDTKGLLSASLFDKRLPPAQIPGVLAGAGIDLPVSGRLVTMIAYTREGRAEDLRLDLRAFLSFLADEYAAGTFAGIVGQGSDGGGGDDGGTPFLSPALLGLILSDDGSPRTAVETAKVLEGTALTPELVKAGYTLYAALHETPPGPLSLRELLSYLQNGFFDLPYVAAIAPAELRETLAAVDLSSAEKQLSGDSYARAILRTSLPTEGEETFAYVERMLEIVEPLTERGVYLVSDSTFAYEMKNSFTREFILISVLTMAAVFLIVALTFRSAVIPLLLVSVIECAVFVTMTIMRFSGVTVYFLAIIVLQSILMGATVDYAILFTSFYREHRRTEDRREALKSAYRGSVGTILTSSVILVSGTLIVGWTAIEIVSKICLAIAYGTICATVLILLFTPAMLAISDRKGKRT